MPATFRTPKLKKRWKPDARTLRKLAFLSKRQAARKVLRGVTIPPGGKIRDNSLIRQLHATIPDYESRQTKNNIRLSMSLAMKRMKMNNEDRNGVYSIQPTLENMVFENLDPGYAREEIAKKVGDKKAGNFLLAFVSELGALHRLRPRDQGSIFQKEFARKLHLARRRKNNPQ